VTRHDSQCKYLFSSLRAHILSAPLGVKILKSASTEFSLITNQWVTRGIFKRLDGVIAYPEEMPYPLLSLDVVQLSEIHVYSLESFES